MTAIETLSEMTEVSQFAFDRRLAKGDSLLFLRALHLANQKAGTTQVAIRKELAWPHSARCQPIRCPDEDEVA